MKTVRILLIGTVVALVCLQGSSALAGLGDFLKGLNKAVGGGGLSEGRIVEGLKEALEIGAGNAVKRVSRVNGYFGNPEIKIPLPGQVQKAEKVLRAVGFGPQVDAFELSMNRAAERAAPEAKALFWDTIKKMTFQDARRILEGRDNEATLYFREKTGDRLNRTFRPLIHEAMGSVGVTRSYQVLEDKVRSMPFTEMFSPDLDAYVTDKALDGLFLLLAEEERRIRKDPAARVTDLLKEVFGRQ
ncbi:MAG: DUF4197 domain-containing protein [Deltaproteobacteria bacterium]|nr:DUF4197 domain-containing protein [Deltaproteobacteria bacterium]